MEVETYRTRFRFRIGKKLSVKDNSYRFQVNGRDALLQAQNDAEAIEDSEWLIINTRGFADDAAAREFGDNLRKSLHLASAVTRLGVDPGVDLPTSAISEHIKQKLASENGVRIRNNIHGLDVFVDDPRVRIFGIHMKGVVRASPNPLLSHTAALYHQVANLSREAQDIILLLNFALMRPEPVAQIIFCISAVEMLGQKEGWSDMQKMILKTLAESALSLEIGSEQERQAVSAAIMRAIHPVSLRQGVLHLLNRLGIGTLRKPWDEIYQERSRLVHGLAPVPGERYDDLASRTVNLCGRILLTRIAEEVTSISQLIDEYYPLRSE